MYTPTSSRHTRTISPPLSVAASSSQALTIGQQTKLNIVTRLAIEGKAKHGHDGASIKMYLKLSVPIDSVAPGSTIPLFPEENLKMLASQVHPIDNNSIPYNFSSATCPLLNNAARALGLPARSERSYLSVFGISPTISSLASSSRSSSPANGVNIPPLDDKYTGHILVSGYNMSYILPREFPPRFRDDSMGSVRASGSRMRRGSIGEKNNMHFMAAIDLLVPYLSRPPRAPYLLSIPVPRCLSNQIKLRIFPPNNSGASSSFASLSSVEEDPGSWDLTSDPHVTRTTSRRSSRTSSYADLADDETSDSSTTGFADGCGIQGTFPSAERIRVRWALPMRNVDVGDGGDGRRRVGVKEVKGEMTCAVLGSGPQGDGIAMRVEYKGTCKGVWFPGVATMLGMDVGLEAKGSDVAWLPDEEIRWNVSGGTGYTGFDAGVDQNIDVPQVSVSPASPPRDSRGPAPALPLRQDSSSSNASMTSLLRAPLPASQGGTDYSFDSPASTPSGTMSSVISEPFLLSQGGRSRSTSVNGVEPATRPPAVPLTIHLNMNDLLPPSRNVFTFTISGTIVVKPRSRSYASAQSSNVDGEGAVMPIVLPRFSILAADAETTSTIIRNEAESSTVEVYNISGDLRDAQSRRTVLQRGGFTRCGSDGGRIALRTIVRSPLRMNGDHNQENGKLPLNRPRTPSVGLSRPSSAASLASAYLALGPPRRRRDGPLIIPSVISTVTPFTLNGATYSTAYAVRVSLPAPCDADSEWLEFGLSQAKASSSKSSRNYTEKGHTQWTPSIEVASACIDGVPVRFEMSAAAEYENGINGFADPGMVLDEMGGNNWLTWIKVHTGDLGGQVEVVYIVKNPSSSGKGKGKAKEGELDISLPRFAIPIGYVEVIIEDANISLRSNLACQQTTPTGRRLQHFAVEELFDPQLSFAPSSNTTPVWRVFLKSLQIFSWIIPYLALLLFFTNMGTQLQRVDYTLERLLASNLSYPSTRAVTETMTVTTTVLPSDHSKWWYGETATTSVSMIQPSPVFVPIPSVTSTTDSLDLSKIMDLTRSSSATTHIPTFTKIENSDSESVLDTYVWPPYWSFQFDIPPAAKEVANGVLEGLGTVWRILLKVYHYPLDPP